MDDQTDEQQNPEKSLVPPTPVPVAGAGMTARSKEVTQAAWLFIASGIAMALVTFLLHLILDKTPEDVTIPCFLPTLPDYSRIWPIDIVNMPVYLLAITVLLQFVHGAGILVGLNRYYTRHLWGRRLLLGAWCAWLIALLIRSNGAFPFLIVEYIIHLFPGFLCYIGLSCWALERLEYVSTTDNGLHVE